MYKAAVKEYAVKALEVVDFMLSHPELSVFRRAYLEKLGDPFGEEILLALEEAGYIVRTLREVLPKRNLMAAKKHLEAYLAKIEEEEENASLQNTLSKVSIVDSAISAVSNLKECLFMIIGGLL